MVSLWAQLDAGARRAFKVANATIPVVAAMRITGVPFDRATHEATIAGWETAYATALEQFIAIAGTPPPAQGQARSAWLAARLPEDMRERWPRTETGLLRTRAADLDRLGAVPEVRPLLDVLEKGKRLKCFGQSLLDKMYPDGRLHMNLKAATTKTGRCSCSDPNVQQLPQDVRRAVIAPEGRTLVIADYSQVELRIAAELSGDEVMRQVFRDGLDMHRLHAASFLGVAPKAITETQRNIVKGVASFGVVYGSGVDGIAGSAWSRYRIEITREQAQHYKDTLLNRYATLYQKQLEVFEAAGETAVLRSICGRPLRAEWEKWWPKWTMCCNFPVQSSAADLMSMAMVRVHGALEQYDAALILQVHDELVVEVAENIAA
jgi:DNA polymerase-1